MYTRKQYLDREIDHQAYYAQFGKKLVDLVSRAIGVKSIKSSTDEHFNDIPLRRWDALQPSVMAIVGYDIGEANGTGSVSLSDCVSAAKSAAQIIRDGE